MRHEITPSEAAAIRKARAHKPVESFKSAHGVWDSIGLADAAAAGNRAAAEVLAELRAQDEMESRAGTQ